jgi:TPR repeat protein
MYANGEGVPEDDATAVMWYTKSAEQGNASAQFNLGLMYDNGDGVPEDDATAVMWYTKAAEQGYADAQLNLGTRYATGEGVPEDDVSAYMWLNLAAALGNENAKNNKEIVAERMTREDISKAQALSRECLAQDYKNCGY